MGPTSATSTSYFGETSGLIRTVSTAAGSIRKREKPRQTGAFYW